MKRMVKWMLIWSSYFLLSWLGSAGSIVSFGSALSIPADYPAITYGCAAVSAVMAALYGIPQEGDSLDICRHVCCASRVLPVRGSAGPYTGSRLCGKPGQHRVFQRD